MSKTLSMRTALNSLDTKPIKDNARSRVYRRPDNMRMFPLSLRLIMKVKSLTFLSGGKPISKMISRGYNLRNWMNSTISERMKSRKTKNKTLNCNTFLRASKTKKMKKMKTNFSLNRKNLKIKKKNFSSSSRSIFSTKLSSNNSKKNKRTKRRTMRRKNSLRRKGSSSKTKQRMKNKKMKKKVNKSQRKTGKKLSECRLNLIDSWQKSRK